MRIEGACHCDNMAFDLEWPDDAPVTPRACGCSFCQKHGAEWTAHAQASLRLRIRDGNRASWYRFGTETADFHVCSQCGVVTACTSEIDGKRYAVVNTCAFEDRSILSAAVAVDFDGEEEGARLGRRARNWIGQVVIEVA